MNDTQQDQTTQDHLVAPNHLVIMFKALGDPTRLEIFRFLCQCCNPVAVEEDGGVRPLVGPTVGAVCCHVTGKDRITSTVSEHLKDLRLAGLIVMERRGRNMICSVNREAVSQLAGFINLNLSCCNPERNQPND